MTDVYAAYIRAFIRQGEAARARAAQERERRLEKALAYAADLIAIVVVKQGDLYSGVHHYRPGDEVFVSGGYSPGEVLGRTSDCPELADWLRARDAKGDEA